MGDNLEDDATGGGNLGECQLLAGIDGAGGGVVGLFRYSRCAATVEEEVFGSCVSGIACLHQGVAAIVSTVEVVHDDITVATALCFWCTIPKGDGVRVRFIAGTLLEAPTVGCLFSVSGSLA